MRAHTLERDDDGDLLFDVRRFARVATNCCGQINAHAPSRRRPLNNAHDFSAHPNGEHGVRHKQMQILKTAHTRARTHSKSHANKTLAAARSYANHFDTENSRVVCDHARASIDGEDDRRRGGDGVHLQAKHANTRSLALGNAGGQWAAMRLAPLTSCTDLSMVPRFGAPTQTRNSGA